MRKRWSAFLRPRLSLLLTAALVLSLLPVSALATERAAPELPGDWPTKSWADMVATETNKTPWKDNGDGRDGSMEKPYIIANEKQLILFGQLEGSDTEGKYYELVSGREYNMGSYEGEELCMYPLFPRSPTATEAMASNFYFGGTLLGNGAQITNAYIKCFDETRNLEFVGGLFSEVRGGTVTDLTVSGTVAGGTGAIGGLVGKLTDRTDEAKENVIKGTLKNCTVEMKFIKSGVPEFFGGLVGSAESADGGCVIENCRATVKGSLDASAGGIVSVGGLVGQATGSTVTGCTATVEGSLGASAEEFAYVGGLMGGAARSTVERSTANVTGSISAGVTGSSDEEASAAAGGLVGFVTESDVNRCGAEVKGISAGGENAAAGGLAGRVNGSTTISKKTSDENKLHASTRAVTLENCNRIETDDISATGANSSAGGLVGHVDGSTAILEDDQNANVAPAATGEEVSLTIEGCKAATGSISAGSAAGGLVGYVDNRTSIGGGFRTTENDKVPNINGVSIKINGCTATVKRDIRTTGGANSSVGGLVGYADGRTIIDRMKNGVIDGGEPGGAVCGLEFFVTRGSIKFDNECVSTVKGSISAGSAAGGLAGHVDSSIDIPEEPQAPTPNNRNVTVCGGTIAIGGTATVAGRVSADFAVGGLVGHVTGSTASREFLIYGGTKITVVGSADLDKPIKTSVGGSATVQTGTNGPLGAVGTAMDTDAVNGKPYTLTGTTTLTLGDSVAVTLTGGDKASSVTETDGVLTMEFNTPLKNDVLVSRDEGTVTIPAGTAPFTVTSGTDTGLPEDWQIVTFDSQGGSPVPGQAVAPNGKLAPPAAPSRSGYTFGGWFKEADCTTPWNFDTDTVTAAITLYAQWTAVPVTPPSGGGGYTPPTYRPEVPKTDGGKVEISDKRPEKGDTVTITPKPEEGKEVADVIITDKNGDPVKVTWNPDGTFSFEQPSGKVTIQVLFADKTPAPLPFRDIPADFWAVDAVRYVYENGLMRGTGADTFSPDATFSRQQLWMTLARMSGEDPANMAEARAWAVSWGISDGSAPGAPVSRQQLAVMLYRFAQSRDSALRGPWAYPLADFFPDGAQVSPYAVDGMCWCAMHGIITGKADGRLDPTGPATRAHAAAMLTRFCEKL